VAEFEQDWHFTPGSSVTDGQCQTPDGATVGIRAAAWQFREMALFRPA